MNWFAAVARPYHLSLAKLKPIAKITRTVGAHIDKIVTMSEAPMVRTMCPGPMERNGCKLIENGKTPAPDNVAGTPTEIINSSNEEYMIVRYGFLVKI